MEEDTLGGEDEFEEHEEVEEDRQQTQPPLPQFPLQYAFFSTSLTAWFRSISMNTQSWFLCGSIQDNQVANPTPPEYDK